MPDRRQNTSRDAALQQILETGHAFNRTATLVLSCVLVIGTLGGCSAFKSKQRFDMGRVAEDMIAITGEIQYNLGQHRPVYMRGYRDTPQLDSLEYETGRARMLVRGVIDYTIQLVSLADSHRPESGKALALADYLEKVLPPVIDGPGPALDLTPDQIDTILVSIREKSKFMDALRAAQPVVDEVAIASREIFDDTKTAMDAAVAALRARIEDRFRKVRTADEMLEQRQIVAVFGLDYLPQIRQGVPGALDSLLALEPSLPSLVATRDGLNDSEIQLIEDRMLTILARTREVRDQLAPDIELYYAHHRELDELENLWHSEIRKARVAVLAWARAHKLIAQGVTDPAKINVRGIARQAAGTALRLP